MNSFTRIGVFSSIGVLCCVVFLSSCAASSSTGSTAALSEAFEGSENCLKVTLTGTMGGPSAYGGLAGSGTLVSYGPRADGCTGTQMQFDVGRGTVMRLSQLNLSANQIDAVFFTHMHSDHTAGFSDLLTTRWHFTGPPLPVVCSADATVGEGDKQRTLSCANMVKGSAATSESSGEIAQRALENPKRNQQGPAGLGQLELVELASAATETIVWDQGDVTVIAVGVTHIPGSLAYRVNSPAGSVVIGGDAGNDKSAPPRDSSTSDAVEELAVGADILVHSVIHPVLAPGGPTNFPAPIFYRQSTPEDLGALAKRSGVRHLMFTHMIPALGAPRMGPFKFPSGLTADDYRVEARKSGFEGDVMVGADLMSLTLPLAAPL